MWITAFKTGTHTDMAGKPRTFTREHLDAIVKKFDPTVRKAPACKGHPDIDSPAYGWFDAVKREGEYLLMHLGEHVQEFGEQVKQGMFKYVSLALRPDMSIRHLGFLGGHPPAIDGLGELDKTEFGSSDDVQEFAFADYNASRIKRLFQSLREYLLVKDGQEEADRRIPQWEVDMLEAEVMESSSFAAPIAPTIVTENPMKKTPEQLQAENEALAAENLRLKGEKETVGSQLTALQFAAAREADKAYLQTLETRLVPARRSDALDLLSILRGHGEFAFAEGGNKPAVDVFKGLLESLPEQLSFGEEATHDRAGAPVVTDVSAGPASRKVTDAVNAKMEKDRGLSFGDASRLVFAEQPDLARAYELELQA
jgi:hypothetical protein